MRADPYGVTLGNEEGQRGVLYLDAQELAEALERHDGLLLSAFEYSENESEDVYLTWTDYGYDEEPLGGSYMIEASEIELVTRWLHALPKPAVHPQLAIRKAEFVREHALTRERLYAGLPDTIEFAGATYRLWARDAVGVGLYGRPHARAHPQRWLLRSPAGELEVSGRPQRPDRRGRPRLWLQPRPAPGQQWIWVRTRP